jgi:hypothetical protein
VLPKDSVTHSGHIDRSIEPPGDTVGNSPVTAPGATRPGSGARQGRIPQVGKGRKLSRFRGKCGVRSVEYAKSRICKLRNRLFLRFSRLGPPEWGSQGGWFANPVALSLSVLHCRDTGDHLIAIRGRFQVAAWLVEFGFTRKFTRATRLPGLQKTARRKPRQNSRLDRQERFQRGRLGSTGNAARRDCATDPLPRRSTCPAELGQFSAVFLQSLAMRPVHEYNVSKGGDTPQVPIISKLAMSDQRHNGITSWHSRQVEGSSLSQIQVASR